MKSPLPFLQNKSFVLKIVIGILVAAAVFCAGFFIGRERGKSSAQKAEETATEAVPEEEINKAILSPKVSDFVYGETSKIYLTYDGEDKKEITGFVTKYSKGELFVNEDGLCSIFSLKKVALTEADIEEFKKKEEASGFSSVGEDYYKFEGNGETIILKDTSRFYTVNGEGAVLSGAVTRKDTKLSIPINNMIFVFGYSFLGVSAEADSVTYSLIK